MLDYALSPTSSTSTPRQAGLKLDFAIVGGSITGLATAFGLARSGHKVHIFEQASEIVRSGCGVLLPPNTTSALARWGLEDEIAKVASGVPPSTFIDLDTNEKFGFMQWSDDVVKEAGARWYALNWGALVEILHRAALREGVEITTNAHVASITPPPEDASRPRPFLTLADGRTFEADVIVGADGANSGVRRAIESVPAQPSRQGMVCYGGLVPKKVMESDPELSKNEILHGTPVYCASSRGLIGHLSSPEDYALHLFWDDTGEPDTWDLQSQAIATAVQDASVPDSFKRLIQAAKFVSRTRYELWPSFDEWVDESGTIVLLGEAARPMAPGGANSTSNPIESAAVFATLFSYLRGPDQISVMLNAYEEVRRTRAEEFFQAEQIQGNLIFLPPGPHRDRLRAAVSRSHEQSPEEQWEQVSSVWAYSAIDAADDWWIEWGVLRERALFASAPATNIRFDDLQISVMAH